MIFVADLIMANTHPSCKRSRLSNLRRSLSHGLPICIVLFLLPGWLLSQEVSAQTNTSYEPGELYKIYGLTIDSEKHDTLNMVAIEIYADGQRILRQISDFDGLFYFSLCSNQIPTDSITIKATGADHKQEFFSFRVVSDTTLLIPLTPDPAQEFTRLMVRNYVEDFINECGTGQYERAYARNAQYRHCDGRILTFREIEKEGDGLTGWKLIE